MANWFDDNAPESYGGSPATTNAVEPGTVDAGTVDPWSEQGNYTAPSAPAEDAFARQVTQWYQQYLGRTPSAQEIESHRSNPGGLAAVQQVITKAAGTPAEPNAPKSGGSGNPMDKAWVGEQVKAAFQKGYGRAPNQSEVDYWVDKALTPDEYSDGYTRQGWNPYWEDRILKRGGDSDPSLAGDAGIMRDVPRWKSGGGSPGGAAGATVNPNASSYDPATFGALNKPFGETFKYGDWGGTTPFTAPAGSEMPDFNPNVPTVAPYQNPAGAFSFGGYGAPAGQGMSLAQMGGKGVAGPGYQSGGMTAVDANGKPIAGPGAGYASGGPSTGRIGTQPGDPGYTGPEMGGVDPRPPGEVRGAPTPTQAIPPNQPGSVDPREIAPSPFTYGDYNNPAGNFSFTRPEVAPLTIDEYKNPQGAFGFTRAEPGAFKYADYQAPKDFAAPTAEDMTQDPSYQIRLKEGLDAAQKSAAARGTLMTGGTLKELTQYGQDQASKEYAAIYGRNFNTWGANAALGQDAYKTNLSKAQSEYQSAREAYDKAYEQAKQTYGINADQYMQQYAANVAKKKTEYDAAVQARDTAYGQASDTWGKNRGAYDTAWGANYGKAKDQYGAAVDAQQTLYNQKLGIYNVNAGQYYTAWNANKNLSDTAYNQQIGTYGVNAANRANKYQNAYSLWNAQNANKKDDWQTNYNKSLDAYKMKYDIWNSQNNNQFDRLYKLSALGQGSW